MPTPDFPDNKPVNASWPMRLWLAAPDWLFRLLGAGVFFGYLVLRLPDYYHRGFWKVGDYFWSPGFSVAMPWGRVLIDLTYLLIALAFCFRLPPRSRAARPGEIIIPLVAAFWPFLPWIIQALLQWFGPGPAERYSTFAINFRTLRPWQFLAGSTLILIGNTLDVWGYSVLFNSVSIVAEARELKVTGPYRLVRHPIYMGQILAQAGVWLFYAQLQVTWIVFYACFVAMQLYRASVEENVLERTFGEQYAAWKRKTFWFI